MKLIVLGECKAVSTLSGGERYCTYIELLNELVRVVFISQIFGILPSYQLKDPAEILQTAAVQVRDLQPQSGQKRIGKGMKRPISIDFI